MHIVYSQQDPAGTRIINNLRKFDEQTGMKREISEINGSLLTSDKIVNEIKTDFLIFASKHKSKSETPSLTIHVPGNWNEAEMGGKDRQISWSNPIKMKQIITLLSKIANQTYSKNISVTLEVDHHGPFCRNPCAFVEIGSTEKEWENDKYAEMVAKAISNYEEMKDIEINKIAIGVGGGHYCPAFNKYEIEGSVAFSHLIPNYAVEKLEYETFLQAFERTTEEIEEVMIDWKGLRQQERKKILEYCERYGIEWIKV